MVLLDYYLNYSYKCKCTLYKQCMKYENIITNLKIIHLLTSSTPGGNSISACELTCTFITSLARNVVPAVQSMQEGRWDRKMYAGHELYGKTLAILGLGRIGREVGLRLKAWGMRVIGYDPITTAEEARAAGIEKMELDEIWPLADYITVHTPLIPETRDLIRAETLGKCRRGVRVVNVARGGIINERDLLVALQSGQCGGAGLDVYTEEPPKSETTRGLIEHARVIATPHLGASTSMFNLLISINE